MKKVIMLLTACVLPALAPAQDKDDCGMHWSEMSSAIHNSEGAVMYAVQYSKCTSAGVCGWPKVALEHSFPFDAQISLRLRGLSCDGTTVTAGFGTSGDYISPNTRYVDQGNWHTFKQVTEVVRVELSYKQDGDRYEIIYDKDRGINETRINGKSEAEYHAEKDRKLAEQNKAALTAGSRSRTTTSSSTTSTPSTGNRGSTAKTGSQGHTSTYTPAPMTPAQRYAGWLRQYSNDLIHEQEVANAQYQKAQEATQNAFAGNVSTKKGLQNMQKSMGDLAQSQDMSTASGRTRAITYGVESVAAGIGSLLVKEHDYEAEARQRQEWAEARAARTKQSDAEKEAVIQQIDNYISGDLIWLLAKVRQPVEKLLLFNSINTRSIKSSQVEGASIYDKVAVGYGADTLVDFQTGMPQRLWDRFDALNAELSSAFATEKNSSTNDLFDKKMHVQALKGKYGEDTKNYYRGLTALFFNDKAFKIKKNDANALSWLQKAGGRHRAAALDAMGEIIYDSAMHSGNTALLQQAFDLFSQSLDNELSKEVFHNLLLAAYKLMTTEGVAGKEKYVERCEDIYGRMYRRLIRNNVFALHRQAGRFIEEKDYASALTLYRIVTDTNYVPPKDYGNVLAYANIDLGNCYANGWGVSKDTAMAVLYYEKAMDHAPQLALEALEKIRDPAAYAEKHAPNHFFYQAIPEPVTAMLDTVAGQQVVSGLQITSAGGYVAQVGGKVIYDGIPKGLLDALAQIQNPKEIYLSPGSKAWAVLHGKNYYNSEGLPSGLLHKMGEYYKNGQEIRYITVSPEGAWVLLSQRNAYAWHGIPDKMAAALDTLNDRSRRIDFAVFGPGGGWLIVFDDYGYWYDNLDDNLVKKVKEFNAKQRTIHYVMFTGGLGFLIN